MEFAVAVTGRSDIPEKNEKGEPMGWWVLAVDTENQQFLIAPGEPATFKWVNAADCRLIKAISPEQPTAIIAAQPIPIVPMPKGPPLVLPGRN